jgi:fumarate reductase subunit C
VTIHFRVLLFLCCITLLSVKLKMDCLLKHFKYPFLFNYPKCFRSVIFFFESTVLLILYLNFLKTSSWFTLAYFVKEKPRNMSFILENEQVETLCISISLFSHINCPGGLPYLTHLLFFFIMDSCINPCKNWKLFDPIVNLLITFNNLPFERENERKYR